MALFASLHHTSSVLRSSIRFNMFPMVVIAEHGQLDEHLDVIILYYLATFLRSFPNFSFVTSAV